MIGPGLFQVHVSVAPEGCLGTTSEQGFVLYQTITPDWCKKQLPHGVPFPWMSKASAKYDGLENVSGCDGAVNGAPRIPARMTP